MVFNGLGGKGWFLEAGREKYNIMIRDKGIVGMDILYQVVTGSGDHKDESVA